MSEHLSALQLDEVAAGVAPRPAHLEHCGSCRDRLEERQRADVALLQSPEAKRRLAALVSRAQEPAGVAASPARWRRVVLLAAPLAAGLALFLAWPRDSLTDGTRLKGAPTVMLLDGSNRQVVRAAPGQMLTLVVGSGGFSHGAVFAIDANGKAETLWPKDGATYAPLPAGAEVRLVELEVTPGDVTVKAAFANEARPLTEEGVQSRTVRLQVP